MTSTECTVQLASAKTIKSLLQQKYRKQNLQSALFVYFTCMFFLRLDLTASCVLDLQIYNHKIASSWQGFNNYAVLSHCGGR